MMSETSTRSFSRDGGLPALVLVHDNEDKNRKARQNESMRCATNAPSGAEAEHADQESNEQDRIGTQMPGGPILGRTIMNHPPRDGGE
jgi:hypothetical protein